MYIRLYLYIFLYCISTFAIADVDTNTDDAQVEHTDPASNYINKNAYSQNPYVTLISGGGTQVLNESQVAYDNVAQKWFSNGAWNVIGLATYFNQNNATNIGYATNIFAQTGYVNGFAFGTLVTVANPVSLNVNPVNLTDQAQDIPINNQITPQELYMEYQYKNIVQVDAGWIGISNSPWLSYYQNNALNLMTYQGIEVSVNAGNQWLLNGLAINAAQLVGETGFSGLTLYNYNSVFNQGGLSNINQGSPGTVAFGATWAPLTHNIDFRIWDYQFYNYANLVYAASTLQLPATQNVIFNIAAQAAVEQPSGNNDILQSSGYGAANSTAIGLQFGINYKIFNLQLAYNNISGPSNAYANGNIVSPYTFSYATDPLFTSGWINGLIELSSGSAYKIAPTLSLLNSQLQIIPSYEYFATTVTPPLSEYDLQLVYHLPQIKGLSLFGGFGYLQQATQVNSNSYQAQIQVSYLY